MAAIWVRISERGELLQQSLIYFRHLDISNHQETIYVEPNKILARIVENLPSLESLDISGTNLAGTGSYESASSADSGTRPSPSPPRGLSEGLNDPSPASPLAAAAASECDIPGLLSRVNRPLEFLGLYKTSHEASMRTHLPAIKVLSCLPFPLKTMKTFSANILGLGRLE